MKNKIIYVMLFLLTTGIIMIPNIANAQEQENEESNTICNVDESIGKINRNNTITINGKKTAIFCTFENQGQALENIKRESKDLLNKIGNKYGFGSINDNNWRQYYEVLESYMGVLYDENEWTEMLNDQYLKLRSFFDIYENVEENAEIRNYVDKSLESRSNINLEEDEEFISLLPNYSELFENYFNSKTEVYANRGSYNASNAVTYAKNNAYNKNSSEYGYITSDCTNFASQVYNKGGLTQENTDNAETGWWHKKNGTKHLHSKSWAYANRFAQYWGLSSTTTNVNTFSSTIKSGDVIVADWTRDGKWNHAGVVVTTSKTVKSLSTSGVGGTAIAAWYYDFEVAQHNPEYQAWASSDKNNWEVTGINGKFGIAKH